MKKICETCRFFDFDEGYCFNSKSDNTLRFITPSDTCEHWRGEDKVRYEAIKLFRKLRLSMDEYRRHFKVAIASLLIMV